MSFPGQQNGGPGVRPPQPGQYPPGHPGAVPQQMPFAQFPQFPQHPQHPQNQTPQQQFQQFPQFPNQPQHHQGQPNPGMQSLQNPGVMQHQHQHQQQRPPLISEAAAEQSSPVFEFLPGVASLVEDLDKRVLVTLRDGRHFVGVMRSFDQYGNVMLEDTYERHVIGNVFADERVGLYVIRGENLVLLGELDQDKENAKLREVSLKEIQDKRAEAKLERAEDEVLRKKLAQQALGLGFEDCL